MNCVRARIVKKPEEYDFSSYQAKVGLKNIKWLDYDSIYLDLGEHGRREQRKYQDWIQESIPTHELEAITRSIQKNWVHGDDGFKKKIENMLGRKFEIRKPGRRAARM